jgi:signal transduction histidine kinase
MRERAAALGGTFAIAARSHGGTRVFVCLPLAS